jgi:hypothetical protein
MLQEKLDEKLACVLVPGTMSYRPDASVGPMAPVLAKGMVAPRRQRLSGTLPECDASEKQVMLEP